MISATRFCTICSADDHVGRRIELRRDLRRAADALRPHAAHARHRHDDLLDRPRHDERHRLRRQRARVRDDDDARELQRRVDAARQRERGDGAADDEGRRQQPDRARLPAAPAPRRSLRRRPCRSASAGVVRRVRRRPSVIAAPSGSPAWPSTMTISPALTPETISTCVPSLRPISHGASLRLLAARDEHRRLFTFAHDRGGGNQHDVRVLLGVDVDLHRRARRECSPASTKARRTGTVAVPASTAAGREMHLQADLAVRRPARSTRWRGSADLDARRVGERHRRDDLETTRIDDAQHRIAGGRLDEIAGIVHTASRRPVEGRAHDRARGDRLRRAQARPRLGERRLGVGHRAIGFFDLPARGDAAVEQLARARLGRLRVLERRLGACDLRLLPLHFGRRARNLEADEHVAPPDAIAARRAGSPRSAPPRARRRRARRPAPGLTMPVACTTPRMVAERRRRGLHGDDGLAVDFLRRLLACRPRPRARHERQDGHDAAMRCFANVMGAALRWRARDRRAPSETARRRRASAGGRRETPAAPAAARRCPSARAGRNPAPAARPAAPAGG